MLRSATNSKDFLGRINSQINLRNPYVLGVFRIVGAFALHSVFILAAVLFITALVIEY